MECLIIKISGSLEQSITLLRANLNIEASFDIIEKRLNIGGKKAYMLFMDGFIKDDIAQRILAQFQKIQPQTMNSFQNAEQFCDAQVSYTETSLETDVVKIVTQVLSGPTLLLVDGFTEGIILDLRTFPTRSIQEPDLEKTTKGSKDGFVETIVFNTALIRRRIRDPKLTFEMINIGNRSRTDIVFGYIEDIVDKSNLDKIRRRLLDLDVRSVTMLQESLIEGIIKSSWLNPFPKARYTERPDVAVSHLLEGKIVIIIDNSPNIILVPTTFFDFIQQAEDYYYPVITGNYIRIIRNTVFLLTLIFTPLWLLATQNVSALPPWLQLIGPRETVAIPLLVQFLILEFAVDGLQLASLNTPSSLGTSLSIIGGLILGDFAVQVGWFVPETILYMAFVTIGSFSQQSTELSYAVKFFRIVLLILVWAFNGLGFLAGILFMCIVLGFTRTLTGDSYLYPLFPFQWQDLKGKIFRSTLRSGKKNNEG